MIKKKYIRGMKVKKKDQYLIATFLLLWYCYLNGLRRFFIPFSSITIPALLIIVLCFVSRIKVKLLDKADEMYCATWIAILLLILVDNVSLETTLSSGGIIQNIVLVVFVLFATYSDERWLSLWMKLTRIYALIHAIATIVFYYNASLYTRFARLMFSGSSLSDVLRYYRKGWMSGLSAHFSTNGMILGIGILFWVEFLLGMLRNKKHSKKHIGFAVVATLIILYALILSSKRSPLLAAMVAIAVTMIVYRKKNVGRRIIALILICLALWAAYQYLADYIPGLTTIIDKSSELEGSSAGILNGRNSLWNLAIEMFTKNPILGCGYGSYKVYATSQGAITTTAHNFYLQVLAELGVVGFILYVLVIVLGAWQAFRCLQKVSSDKKKIFSTDESMAIRIAFEIQIFVMIYNMTSTALTYYYIMIPYFLACAATRSIKLKNKSVRV